MKSLAIGRDDFKHIIENDSYYIDKTKFIEEILKDASMVKLITRPRRFGKTLNMSTLKYFFDIEKKEENRKLFNNLYIEKSKYIEQQGQYPVIFLSLKSLKGNNWENTLKQIKEVINEEYEKHSYIIESLSDSEKLYYNKILYREKGVSYENSLKSLTNFLYKHYTKKVILLIDEYDIPLIEAFKNGYYEEASTFFKVFLGEALKTNQYLEMGVLTGIIKVIKTGIFSDLNNLTVYTILNKNYSDYFGFTEKEVEQVLKDYNIEEDMPAVKSWYDGYKIGDLELYNPWSILNFLHGRSLEPYWIGTSSNDLIKSAMANTSESVKDDFEILLNGGTVETDIVGTSDLRDLLGYKEIWEFLLFSGYLTIVERIEDDIYSLKIPNREIRYLFKKEFMDLSLGSSNFTKIMRALINGNIKGLEKKLNEVLRESTSYFDTGKESFYHGMIFGIFLYLEEKYYVTSNKESGFGRYDMMIEPKDKDSKGFIIEFKVSETEDNLEKRAKEALKQIKNRKYTTELRKKGIKDIVSIGIAFFEKKAKVVWE